MLGGKIISIVITREEKQYFDRMKAMGKIQTKYVRSKYMIVLLTKDYFKSEWSNKELQMAIIKESEKQKSYILCY